MNRIIEIIFKVLTCICHVCSFLRSAMSSLCRKRMDVEQDSVENLDKEEANSSNGKED